MEVKLSKDTDKILCRIYNEYLKRRKAGESKIEKARSFLEKAQKFGDTFLEFAKSRIGRFLLGSLL